MTNQTVDVVQVLGDAYRNQEIVQGIIRGLHKRTLPIIKDGEFVYDEKQQLVQAEQEVFEIILPENIIGYCPVNLLRYIPLNPRSYVHYVGRREPFIIKGLDQSNGLAIVSCVDALKKKADNFWNSITNTPDEEVKERIYTMESIHYNIPQGTIYGFIEGQLAVMYINEWNHQERGQIDVNNGESIEVKILRVDREKKMLRVSRRATLPDPFDYVRNLKEGDLVAGKVTDVNKTHGIFVMLDNNIELKASVPRTLATPVKGDVVSCRVVRINPETKKGRVIIIGYPNGQRRNVDIGSFLYAD